MYYRKPYRTVIYTNDHQYINTIHDLLTENEE